jgi:hypothetical protein
VFRPQVPRLGQNISFVSTCASVAMFGIDHDFRGFSTAELLAEKGGQLRGLQTLVAVLYNSVIYPLVWQDANELASFFCRKWHARII